VSGWDLGAFLRAAVALGISSFLKFSGDVSPEVGPALLPLIACQNDGEENKKGAFIHIQ